jgi:hypothetical protein
MASTFSNLGIELIGTGEQAGTWGLTTNSNLSAIIDNAIVGAVTIAVTGTAVGAPTILQVTDGAASDGQKRILTASGALGSAGYLQIAPNDFAGYYFIRNSTGQSLNVFQGTWNGSDANRAVTIEDGFEAIIRCNGGGVGAVITFINYKLKTGPLLITNESTVGTVITGASSVNALRITQTGSGNALLVEDDTNPDSTPFVIDTSGAVGMGATTVPAGNNFYNAKNLTGATVANANSTVGTIQSDVTLQARGYNTFLATAASAFTLTQLYHYVANQGTIGAGSTLTTQYGFNSTASLVGATNNYAFYAANTGSIALGVSAKTSYAFFSASDIATPTYGTAYAFYANGTAPSVFNGSINMGTLPLAGVNFYNAQAITGNATISYGNATSATIQSDVTGTAVGYRTNLATAASVALTNLNHFQAGQGTFSGTSVTSQFGFNSAGTLIGATNNYAFYAADTAAVTAGKSAYGFYSAVNTVSGGGIATYGFYSAGTAPSVFLGTVNIGTNGAAGINFYNAKTITGATNANACLVQATVQSDVTIEARGYATVLGTAASAFALTNLRHFYTNQGTIGAGSTVTSQVGYYSETNLIGATNNYAFQAGNTGGTALGVGSKTSYAFYSLSNIATPTYGTAYAFYAAGTAPNVFTGTVSIGGTSIPAQLTVIDAVTSGGIDDVGFLQGGVANTSGSGAALYLSSFTGITRGAKIVGFNTSGATNAHAMAFYTNAASASPVEQMRIDSAGNTSIGTTAATYRFNVASGAGTVVWGVNTDATTAYLYSSGIVNVGSTGANSVSLVTNNTARVTVNSTGDVAFTGAINVTGAINKVTITAPATGSTLTIADGKTATINNTLTLAGTDGMTMTFPPASASIGYLEIPQNPKTGSYTLVLSDSGKHIYHAVAAAAATYTIPENASVAYPIGTAITFINMAVANVTIAITTDTMYLAGAGTTGSRTLAQYGSATAIKITNTSWIINGMGLT